MELVVRFTLMLLHSQGEGGNPPPPGRIGQVDVKLVRVMCSELADGRRLWAWVTNVRVLIVFHVANTFL